MVSSTRGEVKEKHRSNGWLAVFWLSAQGNEHACSDRPHPVLGCWASRPSSLGFLCQQFSTLFRNEACGAETDKAEPRPSWRP
jgi:hypothetical protein